MTLNTINLQNDNFLITTYTFVSAKPMQIRYYKKFTLSSHIKFNDRFLLPFVFKKVTLR